MTKNGLKAKLEGVTPCKKCLDNGFATSDCAYCGMPLSPRHEHDHMPIPFRADGVDCVPVCINCHDLKDRIGAEDLDSVVRRALGEATPLARILIAKLLADLYEAKK